MIRIQEIRVSRAARELKRLVAGFPPRRPGSGKWDLWWTKWLRGRFSPSTSVSPVKTVHSTNFSILTITRGRYNRPVVPAVPSGPIRDSTPQYSNKKNKGFYSWPKYVGFSNRTSWFPQSLVKYQDNFLMYRQPFTFKSSIIQNLHSFSILTLHNQCSWESVVKYTNEQAQCSTFAKKYTEEKALLNKQVRISSKSCSKYKLQKYKFTQYKTPININTTEYQIHTQAVMFSTELYDHIYCFSGSICSHVIWTLSTHFAPKLDIRLISLFTRGNIILFVCKIMCRSYLLLRQAIMSLKTWQAENSWDGLKSGNLLWEVLSNICLHIGRVCYLSHGRNSIPNIVYSV
jgi:hypothetical protein